MEDFKRVCQSVCVQQRRFGEVVIRVGGNSDHAATVLYKIQSGSQQGFMSNWIAGATPNLIYPVVNPATIIANPPPRDAARYSKVPRR